MPDSLIALFIAGFLFVAGLVLWYPKRGVLARWERGRRMTERVLCEDALKHLQRCEIHARQPSLESLAGALEIPVDEAVRILDRLGDQGLIEPRPDALRLTPAGREYAMRIIRAHRLWERYLAEETGYSQCEWHDRADQYEHLLSPEQTDRLSATLGNPTHDPHGDPIPTARGDLQPHGGEPLVAMGLNVPLRLVHLEDEPETVYAQLVAEGLHPGMEVWMTEKSAQRVRFWAGGEEHVLAPVVAANISVVRCPERKESIPAEAQRLSTLKPGQKGQVIGISPASHGPERRRLFDLGIIPGTIVQTEFRSPMSDPTAYRIRGALIALRREQSDLIYVANWEGDAGE
jgi:DtxR family Mn-dependent transcriptional regulator